MHEAPKSVRDRMALQRFRDRIAQASIGSSKDSPLQRFILLLDRPFRFFANLTSLGIISVIIAAIVQYSAWRDEKNLTRHQEELTHAISNFSDLSGTLSAVMNLQQMLFYMYREALGYDGKTPVDDLTTKYDVTNAKAISNDYFTSRTALRKNIDVLIAKADLYLDRPTKSEGERVVDQPPTDEPQVFSNRDLLRENGFNCKQHLPMKSERVRVGNITLSWNQARHHVATFYYCLEDIHYSLFPIRAWATMDTTTSHDPRMKILDDGMKADEQITDWIKEMDEIEKKLDLQTKRLNALIKLSTSKIEEIRLRAKENGFFRHQFCFWCEK
jgi:hypothetical protein